MNDEIIIEGLKVFAYHGVNPEEKEYGQTFVLDICASVDLRTAGQSDDLNDTVSYAQMIKTARRVLMAESNDLLERAAQRVVDALFSEYPSVTALTVTLRKPDAPIKADFDAVGVRIYREREAVL